jgi:hypothetical protein
MYAKGRMKDNQQPAAGGTHLYKGGAMEGESVCEHQGEPRGEYKKKKKGKGENRNKSSKRKKMEGESFLSPHERQPMPSSSSSPSHHHQ